MFAEVYAARARLPPLQNKLSEPPRRAILAISAIWWGIELLMMHGERWICRLFRKHFERKEQPSSALPAPPRLRRRPLESHGINSQSVLSLPPSLPPSLLYNAFDVCLFLLNLLYFDEAVNYERAELP